MTTPYRDNVVEAERWCEICGRYPAEPHHWCHSRGAGGGDEPWNLLWLCRRHHEEAHRIGRDTFFERYKRRLSPQRVRDWLEHRGDLP